MKVTTAVQELSRKWNNTSLYVTAEKVEEIIKNYIDDLAGMGYGLKWRTRFFRSSLFGYEWKLREQGNRQRRGASTRKS